MPKVLITVRFPYYGLSGCTETRTGFDPIKKGLPDDTFSVNFYRRPAGRPDKKLSVQSHACMGKFCECDSTTI